MNEELLQQYVVTANSGKYKSWEEINSKFPELSSYDPAVLQQYVVTANSGKYNSWKDINDKFPEFFKTTGMETQQTIEAPVEPPAEAPGFFAGLFKQAKTTFGPQKEKSQILTELQQAPVDYKEYLNKQRILLDQTKTAAPVKYDLYQSNPIPTEQDFNTLSLDEIKKKYGTSKIANRAAGLLEDKNRFTIPVSSLLDQLSNVPKEQQAEVFSNLVSDALRKVREQQVSRKDQLESQITQETAGIPQTFGEAVSRGEFGTYAGSAIGGALGSSAVALTRPVVGGYELTKGEILDMANKAKAESLGQTENEFIVSGGKLDSNAAVEVGSMVSSTLEYVGLGKIASPLFKNLVKEGMKSAMKKGIVEVGKGAATEFSTEFVQSVNEQVSSQMAAGKKPEEIVINWDEALESGIQGGIGGGGLTTVSTVTSGLTRAVAKKRNIEQIDNDINRLTDTGNPEINQQIDNEVTITAPTGDLTYDQEKQGGLPSAEQQGAAPVQEGAQPEGGRAQAETGGVLQVPPTTPGVETQVAPEVAPQVTPEVTPTEDLEAQALQELQQLEQPTTQQPEQPTTEVTPEAEIEAIKRRWQEELNSVKNWRDKIQAAKTKESLQEIVKLIAGKDPYNVKETDFTIVSALQVPDTFEKGKELLIKDLESIEKFFTAQEYKKINTEYESQLAALTPQVTPKEQVTPQVEVTPEVTTQPTTRIEDIERNEERERDRLSEIVRQTKRAIASADDTEVAIQEYNKAKAALDEFDKNVAQRKDKLRADSNIQSIIEDETESSKRAGYEYKTEFDKDPRLAALQSTKDMLEWTNTNEYRDVLRKQGLSEQEIDKDVQRANERDKRDIADLEADLKANPVVEKEVTPQPTTEQPVTEQPTTPQPEVSTTEQPANLNDFKRYFFNKDPKAFGGNLGTALGMSEMGWQKAYNKFAKKATPEELKMLDALRGKQVTNVTTPEVTAQQVEQEVILIDKTALLNAGYTNQQVKLVENNPDKFAQIDDKIVNIETNEVIKPKGRKKTQETPDVKPKETFPKTTYADLEKAMFTPGVKLDELLRIVIGMNNDYSALAEQLLNIYKGNKTVRLTKFDTKKAGRDENNAFGVYRPDNTVAVFVNIIKKYWESKVSPEQAKEEIENNTTRVLLHEIVHAYTVKQIQQAIPVVRMSLKPEIRALKAYLKHGDNQGIKDIITLYLSARDQIKDLQKEQDKDSDYFSYKDRALARILEQAKGTEAYGLTNIHEFLTEAFTTTEFQRLLNRLKSPIAPKTIWQSFVDAVKKILNIATTGSKELSPVKAGSVLESVLRIAPTIMVTDKYFSGVSEGVSMMSPAPQDARTAALTKLAQGLINKGATRENVIERVKQSIAGKFDIDVDAYAEDILAGISVREKEVTGKFNADTEVANIVNTPYNQILTSKKPDNVKPADFKQQQVEALADFLRGKVTSKEQVQDFVLTWNDANPNNQISKNITNEAWDRLKTARPEAAATAVVKINDMIRIQALEWAKGKAQGVRETTKQFREKIIKMVQDSVKGSNLTSNQVNSILAAVKRVNLFTPGSISKLADRIAQIEAKAEYAEKLNNAKSLRKQLSNLAKPKEAKVSNYTALARQFRRIDIDYLTSYSGEGFTGIDPLDAYIAAATAIKNGFANPKLDNYERIIVSQIQDYINHQIDFKNVEQARELAETATEEQIKAIAVDGMSVKELESLVNELQMQERAQELQEQLREMDNPDGILNKLNSVDLNTLNADELATYIHVADNIIANEDYSLVDKFSNKLLSKERIAELNKTLGSVNKGKLIQGYKGLQQITQMLDAIFNFSKYAATMYNLSGIYDYIAGTARVENRKIAMAKSFEKEIDRIDSKNMGKPQLRLKTEQAKLLMLSELGKYTLDSTEHIEKVHDNIQKSIDKWKKKNKKYGDEIQKIYDQYKNVMSAEEAIEAFKKNDPHVYELWKYTTNQIFTKELTDEVALNTKSVHNKVFIPFVNYSPTALTTIDIEAAPAEQERKSAKPVQAGTTKEARRTMSSGQAYDFDNYINDILYAFTETIHDVETSKHLQLFNNVANNPDFENLIGGSDNRNYIIQRVVSTDKIERKLGDKVNETVSILNNIADGISQFGVTTALGGLDQMALQYPSAAVTTMIMLGSDAGLFFAAPTKLNPKMQEAVNKILEKQDIAVRGQAHKYELNNKNFDFKSKSKIIKGLSKVRSGLSYLQKDLLLKPLILSDMSVAQRSYIAFYMKSLRDQGIKNVDLMTEPDMINEPSRKQALAYASMMLSNLQVASTTAGRSAFIQEPGNLGVLRKVLLPFSSFPINTKIRMIRALNKLYSSPKRTEGLQELIAVMTEAATFASIKIYLLPFYYAAVKAGMEAIAGFEAPEDEEEEDRNKNWRKLKTQMALEAIPFNVGSVGAWGSQWMINKMNYAMTETEARTTQEFLKDMGEDPMFERLQSWNKYNEFYGYGQYGIGMDRYADIINAGVNYFRDDFVTLDNGYGEQIINKDSQELERLAMMNLLIQALPATPRELRTQMGKIEREQFKMAKERQSEE